MTRVFNQTGARGGTLFGSWVVVMWLMSITSASGQPTGPESTESVSLLPVPALSLESVEPAVRTQLETLREELNVIVARADSSNENATAASRDELAEAFGELGQMHLVYDLLEVAEPALLNAQQLAPRFRWAYLLGSLYQLDNRLDQAATQLEEALRRRPDDPTALARLAQIELRRQRSPEALRAASRLLELASGAETGASAYEAAARANLGILARESGDAATAVQHLERAVALQPAANQLYYHLALAHRALGNDEKVRRYFELRGDQEVRYPDPLAQELQGLATGAGAWLSLGRMSAKGGHLEVAEERFRKATEIDPRSAPAWRSLAVAVLQQGRAEEAIGHYERSLEIDPDNVNVRTDVATLLLDSLDRESGFPNDEKNQRLGRAAAHLSKALSLAPSYLAARVLLATTHRRLGDPEAAAGELRTAIAQAPNSAELRLRLAQLELEAGRRDQAIATLEELNTAALPAELAQVANELRGLDRAQQALRFDRAVFNSAEATPEQKATASFHLANAMVATGDLTGAVGEYQRALELAPELAEARLNLGTVFGRLGRYFEAAEQNALVLSWQPENHQARFGECMALVLAGDHKKARQRLERALELYPSQIVFGHLLARLLVASSDDAVRDGAVGLDLANRVFEAQPGPEHAETVAMGLAEIGRFDDALNWQQRLVEQYEAAGQPLPKAITERLESYRQSKPVRDPWSDGD